MHYRYFFLLPILATTATASLVANLTAATLPAFIASNELSLVAYIAPWCEFCHDLYPEYEEAAEMLQAETWPLARINCDTDLDLCQEYRVPIYPTIHVFHGSNYSIYNGRRQAPAIVDFMKRHSQPALTRLDTAAEAADFSIRDKVTVIGFLDESDASFEVFKATAESHRDNYLFGYTSDPVFGSAENVQKPSIVVYKAFEDGRVVYKEGQFDSETVRDFVNDAALPYIYELGKELNHATSTNRPIAMILARSQEREQLKNLLWPAAKETRGQMLWLMVDPEKYPDYAPKLGMSDGAWPAFGIEDQKNDFKYAFPKRGSISDLNPAAIRQVVEGFLNKRLVGSEKTNDTTESKPATTWQDPLKQLEEASGGAWKAPRDEL